MKAKFLPALLATLTIPTLSEANVKPDLAATGVLILSRAFLMLIFMPAQVYRSLTGNFNFIWYGICSYHIIETRR